MRARPREVPVEKPSAVQSYVPAVLLRPDERGARRRWLPTDRRPGASKHLLQQPEDVMKIKVDMNEYCSEADVERLEAMETEIAIMEGEMYKFVEEFYVAAATFSTLASAQRALMDRLQSASN